MSCYSPGDYVQLLYADRLRTPADKQHVIQLFRDMFGDRYPIHDFNGDYSISPAHVQVGKAVLRRRAEGWQCDAVVSEKSLLLLHRTLPQLESLMQCVNMNWMTILVSNL